MTPPGVFFFRNLSEFMSDEWWCFRVKIASMWHVCHLTHAWCWSLRCVFHFRLKERANHFDKAFRTCFKSSHLYKGSFVFRVCFRCFIDCCFHVCCRCWCACPFKQQRDMDGRCRSRAFVSRQSMSDLQQTFLQVCYVLMFRLPVCNSSSLLLTYLFMFCLFYSPSVVFLLC